jgi:hypothetical protein
MLVPENTELSGETLADRLYVGCAGHRESKPATSAHCQPVEFIIGESTIGMALQIRERREREAILQFRPTKELKGIK